MIFSNKTELMDLHRKYIIDSSVEAANDMNLLENQANEGLKDLYIGQFHSLVFSVCKKFHSKVESNYKETHGMGWESELSYLRYGK